jgi:leucyl aminopeptidase (aminopeptidase T)
MSSDLSQVNGQDSLDELATRVVRDYLAVQPDESFLIVSDEGADLEILDALVRAARELGSDVAHSRIAVRETSGAEPPPAVASALAASDVALSVTARSILHTNAVTAARAGGMRGVLNSPAGVDAWKNGAMQADFFEVRKVGERLADAIRGSESVHVTSPAGTDVVMGVHGREPKGWLTGICHKAGELSAYPGGEVSFPPMEGTSNGVIVIEHVMTDLGRLSEPMTWEVRDGEVVSIEGGQDAARLRELIEGVPNATNIGELGIGINPLARLNDDITESKKRLGTAHVAVGDSAGGGYGGAVECSLHLDGMVLDVSISVDGRQVIQDGKLLI